MVKNGGMGSGRKRGEEKVGRKERKSENNGCTLLAPTSGFPNSINIKMKIEHE
jgi:hypothetical protein